MDVLFQVVIISAFYYLIPALILSWVLKPLIEVLRKNYEQSLQIRELAEQQLQSNKQLLAAHNETNNILSGLLKRLEQNSA
jgi:hypothetical protein